MLHNITKMFFFEKRNRHTHVHALFLSSQLGMCVQYQSFYVQMYADLAVVVPPEQRFTCLNEWSNFVCLYLSTRFFFLLFPPPPCYPFRICFSIPSLSLWQNCAQWSNFSLWKKTLMKEWEGGRRVAGGWRGRTTLVSCSTSWPPQNLAGRALLPLPRLSSASSSNLPAAGSPSSSTTVDLNVACASVYPSPCDFFRASVSSAPFFRTDFCPRLTPEEVHSAIHFATQWLGSPEWDTLPLKYFFRDRKPFLTPCFN